MIPSDGQSVQAALEIQQIPEAQGALVELWDVC